MTELSGRKDDAAFLLPAAVAGREPLAEGVLQALPEPALLVTGAGVIRAVNGAAVALFGTSPAALRGTRLVEHLADAPAEIALFLAACARTRSPIPGALHPRASRGDGHLASMPPRRGVAGAVVRPARPSAPALILLRFRGDEVASNRFNLLNRQLEELTREVRARRLAESALRDANMRLTAQALELEQQMEEAKALTELLEQTNERWQQAAQRGERLLAVSAGLSAATTPEEVADVIFHDGLSALGADAGSLALVRPAVSADGDPHGEIELEMVRTVGYPAPVAERYRRFPLTPGRPLSDAVRTRTPVLLASLEEWRRAYPATEPDVTGMGYEAYAAIPVVSGGRVLAGLSASFRRPVTFDAATRTFLATLGEQCGLALERSRAYDSEHRAREQSAFLAEASRLLAGSLDYATTLRTLAEAAVPRLGDWCAVDIVRDLTESAWPPALERVAIVHRDAEQLALAAALAERYPTDWTTESGLAAVFRQGTPLFAPVVTDEMLDRGARDAEHLALLRTLRLSSVLVVPLIARGRTLGALTLCRTEPGRHYDRADLALAEELAQRAALAVDNARLFRDAELARAAAEEANRGKSQFLAVMSHELRTPLNAIGGYVELLELGIRGPITDAQREDLERIRRAQRHLLVLISELLNFTRVESGHVHYNCTAVRVDALLRGLEPLIAPQLRAQELRYVYEGVAEGAVAWADQEKLEQILLNLLSNAVKFTRRGGTITLTADADESTVQLRVRDTGVGIAPDKIERIFEPFVQLDQSLTRPRDGVGLGLAISRDLARGMGGDLSVQSTPGVGSMFILTLPTAP